MEAAKRIVEEGYGVTIIPATAARREIDAGLLKRLDVEGFALTVDYGLFYPKGRLFSGAAEAFLATLCNLGIFSHGENLRGHPWRTP
jgi:DNA-binding transcriptional LysR family regulator